MIKTNKLVIIGGPASSGKSYLIEKIKNGELDEICTYLNVEDLKTWDFFNAKHLHLVKEEFIDKMVLHYDFTKQYSEDKGFNLIDKIVENAKETIVLTLCVPTKVLMRRMTYRLIKRSIHFWIKPKDFEKNPGHIKNLSKKRRKFKKKNFILDLYKLWFESLNGRKGVSIWMIDTSKPEISMPVRYNAENPFCF